MVGLIDKISTQDVIELTVRRGGKTIDTRVTSTCPWWARLLKSIGLGKHLADDLVVNAMKAWLAQSVADGFTYCAIGTGVTAPAGANTSLGNEIMRVSGSTSRVTVNVTNDTYQIVAVFNITGTYAITEGGIFTASSGGTLGCRQTFGALNLINGDQVTLTWKLTFS